MGLPVNLFLIMSFIGNCFLFPYMGLLFKKAQDVEVKDKIFLFPYMGFYGYYGWVLSSVSYCFLFPYMGFTFDLLPSDVRARYELSIPLYGIRRYLKNKEHAVFKILPTFYSLIWD